MINNIKNLPLLLCLLIYESKDKIIKLVILKIYYCYIIKL